MLPPLSGCLVRAAARLREPLPPPAVEPLRPIPRVCAISSAAGGGVRELELEGLMMIHADEVLRISLSLVRGRGAQSKEQEGEGGRVTKSM